jgi:hypothetical protein
VIPAGAPQARSEGIGIAPALFALVLDGKIRFRDLTSGMSSAPFATESNLPALSCEVPAGESESS